MFWSEIGSGFGEPGGTPLLKIPRSNPPPLLPGDRFNFSLKVNNSMRLRYFFGQKPLKATFDDICKKKEISKKKIFHIQKPDVTSNCSVIEPSRT